MAGPDVLIESNEPGSTWNREPNACALCQALSGGINHIGARRGVHNTGRIFVYLFQLTYQRSWSTKVLVSSKSSNKALRYTIESGPSMPYVLS